MGDLMGNLGLFGGGGPFGGAMASVFQSIIRMLYYMVTRGSIPVIAAGVGVGSVIGGPDSYITGGFNPDAEIPPLVTLDERAQYATDRHQESMTQLSDAANTVSAVADEMAQSERIAEAIEGGLADPVGMVAALQNIGSAALLTQGEVKRGNALLATQTGILMRQEKERQDAREQAVKLAERVFPQTGDGRMAADAVTFNPLQRY